MKKLSALLIPLLVFCFQSFSQHGEIKGTVIDTSEKRNLTYSVVALLRPADSVLVTFTRTDKSGNFTLQKLSPGKYILMVTHPAYADYFDPIDVPAAPANLGNISMILKSQLLQEVVVQHKLGAIRIKGDTTEYIADSFKLAAGASVEDLLKKLPGIQVDRNGKITAQGETVQKVLVDGEEFFSDDPTIVTRNLTADAVDKVQQYKKSSDQAAFTGIDDGQKTNVIDLKLKEDKKKGYFGKIEAGSDGDKYWSNNFMFNAFKKKRKFSAFGIMSNTGKTGLDFAESQNYGGSNANMETNGDMVYFNIDNYDNEFGSGSFRGEGLPTGWAAGLHYSNKWNADKIHLNTGYQYNKLNTEAAGITESQYILPDTILYTNETRNTLTSRYRNRLDALYEFQIDSLSSIKITAVGSKGNNYNHTDYHQISHNSFNDTLSIINRQTTTNADNQNFNSTFLWKQKFKKTGRTISVAGRQNYVENQSTGVYSSDNEYFKNGVLDSLKILDQQKLINSKTASFNARATYTEPLSKRALLEFNYSIDNNHRTSNITTLEKKDPSNLKYENQIDSLSNNYSYNVLTHSGGINYRYAKPKRITLSFGMNVSSAIYNRKDLRKDSSFTYSFTNFYPQASMTLNMGPNGNLRFNYNGSTQAPSIDQIQPIQDITDQLNIRKGNPDLQQAFRHNFNLSFNNYKFLSQRGIWINLYGSLTQHDFSTMNYLDLTTGRKVYQPVNVEGNYSMNGYLGYDRKIKKWNLNVGISGRGYTNHNTNYIDGLKNVNNSYTFGAGPEFGYDKEKKFSFWASTSFMRNISKSSLRSSLVTKYWTQEHYAEIQVYLPWKFKIGNSANFSFREKTSAFDKNNNVIRWNAWLERKMFKQDAGTLKFQAFDILDQNIGFNRNINSNFISETTNNTIRRYFMLSFIWNFSKNGKPAEW